MKRFFIADQDNYNIYYIQIFSLRFPHKVPTVLSVIKIAYLCRHRH